MKTAIFLIATLILSVHISFSRDNQKELIYEQQLEKFNPDLVSVFHAATVALDSNQLQLADSLYTIVYKNAPGFDIVLRRLGNVKCQLGQSLEGTKLLQKAVEINRSAYNLLTLASIYSGIYELPNAQKAEPYEAIDLIKEAEQFPEGSEFEFSALMAQIGLKYNIDADFKSAARKLLKNHPDQMLSHYYGALYYASNEKWEEAESEITKAHEMGLSDNAYQSFLDSGVHTKVRNHGIMYKFLWITLYWVIGLILLYFLGKILSNFTLFSIKKEVKTNVESKASKLLRPIYKFLINIGGIYYYLSLPIILILVLAIVGSLVYVFIMIGRIPIQLMLIVVIGSGLTIYGMVRSLLVKIDYSDPGRELKRDEAPDLFALTEKVAREIGTRPIDEIRITATTDLAVYEKGSWSQKMRDKARRILILGTGVLKDFKVDDFKSVLAHEYGHFANRDTAGGEVAMRVQNDMYKYIYALYASGQNVWWNIAFHFLRMYHFIFRRISHGATRLQEVMADRIAAQTYGTIAFENGLSYVIKRELEFNLNANAEIEEAKQQQRAFNNLYELSGRHIDTLEKEFNNAINAKTTEDNTHPSPKDRFEYISNIKTIPTEQSDKLVRELFIDWNALTLEMTKWIEERVNKKK